MPTKQPKTDEARRTYRERNPEWYGDSAPASQKANDSFRSRVRRYAETGRVPRSLGDMTPEQRLRHDIGRAGDLYRERINSTDLFGRPANEQTGEPAKPPQNRAQMKDTIQNQHQGFVGMMLAACGAQLMGKKINADTLIKTVSMGVGMWLFSPKLRDAVDPHIGMDTRKSYERDFNEYIGERERSSRPARAKQGRKWRKAFDEVRSAPETGPAPFTEYSAALTHIALNEKAYMEMRVPGANIEQIQTAHSQAVSTLYDSAAEDGVQRESIEKMARKLVGQMSRDNPMTSSMYVEMAHDDYRVTPDKKMKLTGFKEPVSVWDGGIIRRHDKAKVDKGMFTVRPPMSPAQHQAKLADRIAEDMLNCKDADEMHKMMFAWAAARHPQFKEHNSDPDTAQDLVALDRMFAAMEQDGATPAQAHMLYTNAYAAALAQVHEKKPELEQEWSDKYGTTWRETFADMLNDPSDSAGRWKSTAEARQRAAQARQRQSEASASRTGRGGPQTASGKGRGRENPDERERENEDEHPLHEDSTSTKTGKRNTKRQTYRYAAKKKAQPRPTTSQPKQEPSVVEGTIVEPDAGPSF